MIKVNMEEVAKEEDSEEIPTAEEKIEVFDVTTLEVSVQ